MNACEEFTQAPGEKGRARSALLRVGRDCYNGRVMMGSLMEWEEVKLDCPSHLANFPCPFMAAPREGKGRGRRLI